MKFHVSNGKSKILLFHGFFYLNQIKFQLVFIWNCIWFGQKEPIKKKGYLSWHWRVMQRLQENWLVALNMTWGIWWIFTQPIKSLNIFDELFMSKVYKVWALKIQSSYLSWHWTHYAKSIQIWSFLWSVFPPIWIEFEKIRPKKTRRICTRFTQWEWRKIWIN